MNNNGSLSTMLENIIHQNIDRFLSSGTERLHTITVEDIRHQNHFSVRFGGKCTIEYWDTNNNLAKRFCWIKKVEDPEKFYVELSSVYNSLERIGLHSNITKPYLFNLELGIICLSYIEGSSLLKHTLRHSLSFPSTLPKQLLQLYANLGKWLQQYHKVMASTETTGMPEILEHLQDILESDSSFDRAEKDILQRHINDIGENSTGKLRLTLVRTHNDFTLRNIMLSEKGFGIIDWDDMVQPELPDRASVWNELSYFMLNLQSMLRFHPLISRPKIHQLKQSFLRGYFEKNSLAELDSFQKMFFIFTLRSFLGIDSDRPLSQIYQRRFGKRYMRLLKKNLLQGCADITGLFPR